MIDTLIPDLKALEQYGFVPFGKFGIAQTGESTLQFIDEAVADYRRGIYTWVIDKEIVRIGASKNPLRARAKQHSRWIEMRLLGIAKITDEKKLAKQTEEAKRWQAALTNGRSAIIWGRRGTIVKTPVGELNTYLAEENALLEAYRPKFNNSFFR